MTDATKMFSMDTQITSDIKSYVKGVALSSEVHNVSVFSNSNEYLLTIHVGFIHNNKLCSGQFTLSEHMFNLMSIDEIESLILKYFVGVRNNTLRVHETRCD